MSSKSPHREIAKAAGGTRTHNLQITNQPGIAAAAAETAIPADSAAQAQRAASESDADADAWWSGLSADAKARVMALATEPRT